jgi:Zn-dependent protease with chaperone function
MIIALAYDSGGVTTSTVTVPIVAALGLGLASTVPGRSALLDGFGLIAFASLFPIIAVMAYAQISRWRAQYSEKQLQQK